MKDEIKEKLEKEKQDLINSSTNGLTDWVKGILLDITTAKINQHERTKSSLIEKFKEMIEKERDECIKNDWHIPSSLNNVLQKLSEMEKEK